MKPASAWGMAVLTPLSAVNLRRTQAALAASPQASAGPSAANRIRDPLPFGQKQAYLKFYVIDLKTKAFGFVF